MAKNRIPASGIVYSTDPGYNPGNENEDHLITPEPGQQKLTIALDTKQRGGKAVTLLQGFSGKEEDMKMLGKRLKSFCGTGGSVKDGQIIIQGDNREKILQWLLKNGYMKVKKM